MKKHILLVRKLLPKIHFKEIILMLYKVTKNPQIELYQTRDTMGELICKYYISFLEQVKNSPSLFTALFLIFEFSRFRLVSLFLVHSLSRCFSLFLPLLSVALYKKSNCRTGQMLYNSVVQLRACGPHAARGTILHKSCRLQAAATFFFEERYDFGTKIGILQTDSK